MAPTALLLLPPPPDPSTFAAVKASYNAPLLLALRNCSNAASGSTLDIALPCPQLYSKQGASRASAYASIQSLLANVYKLVCIVAARDRINVEDASGVDVRVLLIAYPRDGNVQSSPVHQSVESSSEGPVIDIAALARCHKSWSSIYSVESEEGEQLLNQFRSSGAATASVQKLRGGIVQVVQSRETPKDVEESHKAHYHVVVGGTFDHLHIGHKLLLTMTAFALDLAAGSQERTITIGITAEAQLANKKFAEFLQDWHERYAATHAFLHSLISFDPQSSHPEKISEVKNPGPNGHLITAAYPSGLTIKYVEIWDPFGPTITEENLDALIISAETRSGGKAVNDKRAEQGWQALDVYEVDVLDAEDSDNHAAGTAADAAGVQQAFQNKLSSTEIRKKQASSRSKV